MLHTAPVPDEVNITDLNIHLFHGHNYNKNTYCLIYPAHFWSRLVWKILIIVLHVHVIMARIVLQLIIPLIALSMCCPLTLSNLECLLLVQGRYAAYSPVAKGLCAKFTGRIQRFLLLLGVVFNVAKKDNSKLFQQIALFHLRVYWFRFLCCRTNHALSPKIAILKTS